METSRPGSIVLASREVWPFVEGGGIGRYVWAAAHTLAPHAEVTILTSARWRSRYQELLRAGDDRLPPGVRFAFADEPSGDLSPFVSWAHLWSLRLLEAAARLYPSGGPDVLEMPDYHAEGFAAAHARRGRDPRLRNTILAIGLHTSAEMCAVLDEEPESLHLQVLGGCERFALRFADVLLGPGGNSLERYAAFYGDGSLAPCVPRPLPTSADSDRAQASLDAAPADGPLRLLYLNRLQRLKGIAELVAAVRSLPEAELNLSIVGRDTATGPNQESMRAHVEELAAGDPRIVLHEQVAHEEVSGLIARHHVVVVPSHWEAFSYVVREALACNRPVLATPVGAIVDVIRPGQSGWLARSSSPEDLAAALRDLMAARETIDAMVSKGLPRAVFEAEPTGERTVQAYRELLARSQAEARRDPLTDVPRPRMAALVACVSAGAEPLPTLHSLERQRGVSVDAVLIAGRAGRLPGGGPALARARAVVASPASRDAAPVAWASGLAHTSAELVLLLPAGTVLAPDFVLRAAQALSAEPDLAYVTALVRTGSNSWHAPLGSYELPVAELDCGPSVALVRRTALAQALGDPGAAPDGESQLFARLAEIGAHGLVLQEPLVESLPTGRTPSPARGG